MGVTYKKPARRYSKREIRDNMYEMSKALFESIELRHDIPIYCASDLIKPPEDDLSEEQSKEPKKKWKNPFRK